MDQLPKKLKIEWTKASAREMFDTMNGLLDYVDELQSRVRGLEYAVYGHLPTEGNPSFAERVGRLEARVQGLSQPTQSAYDFREEAKKALLEVLEEGIGHEYHYHLDA